MDILKKNVLSVLCGLVALVAVFSFVWPTSGYKQQTQKELDQRKELHQKLMGLESKGRHLPVVSTDPNAPQQDLTVFPGPKVLEAGKAAVQQVKSQSVALQKLVVQMNEHKLLMPGSLPEPQDAYGFRGRYLQKLQSFQAELNAATPPTPDEIEAQAQKMADDKMKDAPRDAATGEVLGKEAFAQQIERDVANLPDKMRKDAALSHKMYMAAEALPVHPAFDTQQQGQGNKQPNAEEIWLAQMDLWVYEDVVKAIASLNRNSSNVDESPVKQLVSVIVPSDKNMYVLPTANASSGSAPTTPDTSNTAAPSLVPANSDTDAFPKDYGVSPTGRACNGVYDVVKFNVHLVVDAADVDKVIAEIERGKLITVNNSGVDAVNSAYQKLQGFYFGNHPVVLLTMHCEELFMRDWTRSYMPKPIKQYLNVQDKPQQTAMNQELLRSPPSGPVQEVYHAEDTRHP